MECIDYEEEKSRIRFVIKLFIEWKIEKNNEFVRSLGFERDKKKDSEYGLWPHSTWRRQNLWSDVLPCLWESHVATWLLIFQFLPPLDKVANFSTDLLSKPSNQHINQPFIIKPIQLRNFSMQQNKFLNSTFFFTIIYEQYLGVTYLGIRIGYWHPEVSVYLSSIEKKKTHNWLLDFNIQNYPELLNLHFFTFEMFMDINIRKQKIKYNLPNISI